MVLLHPLVGKLGTTQSTDPSVNLLRLKYKSGNTLHTNWKRLILCIHMFEEYDVSQLYRPDGTFIYPWCSCLLFLNCWYTLISLKSKNKIKMTDTVELQLLWFGYTFLCGWLHIPGLLNSYDSLLWSTRITSYLQCNWHNKQRESTNISKTLNHKDFNPVSFHGNLVSSASRAWNSREHQSTF